MRTLRVAITALICASALVSPALPGEQISYQFESPDGPPTPGPTYPNAPSS